jgi:diaminopimelate decarboxylase
MECNPNLKSIIDRFDAPFFYYDLDKLQGHLEEMAQVLHPDIKLWYACKANPMSAILKVLRNLGFGIDIASTGEMHQVLNTGIKGQDLIATGPGKSKEYLSHLVKSGVENIVIESHNQLIWLNEVCHELNTQTNALLRLQLDWQEGKSVLGGNSITPFGLDSQEWQKINIEDYPHINIKGIHIFQWGNILETDRLETIWRRCIEEAQSLAHSLDLRLEIIDLGGGLGVPYKDETPLNFKEVHQLLVSLKEEYQLEKIWMELGRFAVAECGQYLTKVLDKKTVRGRDILVVEGGINHIARPALTNEAFPCISFRKSSASKEYHVHGPLCTSLDFLGAHELPTDIQIGDWIVFNQSGAYGFTESMPYFLCHGLPGEVIKYRDDLMIPRPPKTSYEWMI